MPGSILNTTLRDLLIAAKKSQLVSSKLRFVFVRMRCLAMTNAEILAHFKAGGLNQQGLTHLGELLDKGFNKYDVVRLLENTHLTNCSVEGVQQTANVILSNLHYLSKNPPPDGCKRLGTLAARLKQNNAQVVGVAAELERARKTGAKEVSAPFIKDKKSDLDNVRPGYLEQVKYYADGTKVTDAKGLRVWFGYAKDIENNPGRLPINLVVRNKDGGVADSVKNLIKELNGNGPPPIKIVNMSEL